MVSTTSIDLIKQIIQPFQRSLGEALRVMDCGIDEERSRPGTADDASSPVSDTNNLSKSARTAAGPDLPPSVPYGPKPAQHACLPDKSAISQSPSLAGKIGRVSNIPQAFNPETPSGFASDKAENLTTGQMVSDGAAASGTEPASRARPAIKPNTAKAASADLAGSGPDLIDAAPHGMPISNGGNSKQPASRDMPQSVDRSSGTGRIERLQSPHRHTSLDPNIRETTPIVKSAALVPLKVTVKSPLVEAVPAARLNSTIPPAPRPVRRAAGMVAEGLEPVLDQAYGITQQAFEPLTAAIPGEDEVPLATRVSNNFHVNVSMNGTNTTGNEQHEAFEEALVDILRLAARRHGLEV